MLNVHLVDSLYASLPRERQQELIGLLFKRSKQTMNYFHRTKDITLSKLETLADFFHMPLDYFRADSSFQANNVNGNNNYVGNVTTGTNLLIENQSLRDKLRSAESEIKTLKKMSDMQLDYIENLKSQIAALTAGRK